MTIQTTQASEATQAVASLAEAAVAASQEMQQGATVTMALNREHQYVKLKPVVQLETQPSRTKQPLTPSPPSPKPPFKAAGRSSSPGKPRQPSERSPEFKMQTMPFGSGTALVKPVQFGPLVTAILSLTALHLE
ncbi:UNVERIFIED_CONTAM: hypothetical protein K2H54_077259 [Gekko kuhli]